MKDISSRTSPRRILNILEEIIVDPNNFTAKKISHKLKIPLPTIYRHIETLCEEKYLVAGGSKKYLPGPRIRNLILKSLPYEPNFTLRRSYLRKLTNDIEETVSLSMPIGTKLVYFDRIEFHWPMQLNLEAGDHLPLHASASGKLYLLISLSLTLYYNYICYDLYKFKKNKFELKKAKKVFAYSILYLLLIFVLFLVDNLI